MNPREALSQPPRQCSLLRGKVQTAKEMWTKLLGCPVKPQSYFLSLGTGVLDRIDGLCKMGNMFFTLPGEVGIRKANVINGLFS